MDQDPVELKIKIRIDKSSEGRYIPVPFEAGENIERIDIRYRYGTTEEGGVIRRSEEAVIDLAVADPGGDLLGASGSDRDHVWVSPLGSADGFDTRHIQGGRWEIIAGAYKVPPQGIEVSYDITLHPKARRLFRGDTHVHTTASDGTASPGEIISLARQQGLDFVFLTDHNNYAQNFAIPPCPELTVLPGCEWTHYQGHAGFLGVKRPFEGTYVTASLEETAALFRRAREQGALTVLNHPFCPLVPWKWGFDLPFDGVEVWNGVMSERNERAAAWWQTRLAAGVRLPITGGSDYHRPGLLGSLAMPCHCIWAPSREPADIMAALREGSGYVSYLPQGPGLDALWQGAQGCLGARIPPGADISFRFFALQGGDRIRLITAAETEEIPCPEGVVAMTLERAYQDTPFVRAELYRVYAPGLPPMKALLSNPVYFAQPGGAAE